MNDKKNIQCLLLGIFLGWVLNMVFRHYEYVEDVQSLYDAGYEEGFDFGKRIKLEELKQILKDTNEYKILRTNS